MRKLALALLLLLCPLLTPLAQTSDLGSSATPTLVIGLIDFPPLSYYDQAGQPDGLLVPLMSSIVERAGYEPEFRILPMARLVQGMQEGTIRVWPGIPGKQGLADHTRAGSQQLAQLNINLYHRPDTQPPHWPDEVRGEELIMMTGYDYGPVLTAQIQTLGDQVRIHRTQSHSAAIGMLLHRRASYLVNYQAPMEDALAQRPDVQLIHHTLARTPLVLVVSSVGRPAAETLLAQLEQAYLDLQQEDKLTRLPHF
jgi:polar amino acid transport system substrate-binding protein